MPLTGLQQFDYEDQLQSLKARVENLRDRLAEREAEIDNWAVEVRDLREYIDLLENQVIVAMTEDQPELKPNLQALFASPLIFDEPIPFLPVDPEEKRRLDAKASDGRQCMVYRSNP